MIKAIKERAETLDIKKLSVKITFALKFETCLLLHQFLIS